MTGAGVTPEAPAPPGVEVVRRRDAESTYLFVLNHTDDPASVPADGTDLVTGEPVAGTVDLAPGGVAVVRGR